MTTYNITNKTSGADLGTYEGANETEALDAMARDAGYKSYADCCEQTGTDGSDLAITKADA